MGWAEKRRGGGKGKYIVAMLHMFVVVYGLHIHMVHAGELTKCTNCAMMLDTGV